MKITTILPVSRTKYLNRVLESLKNQTVKPDSLLVVWDGHDEEYIQVRNIILQEKYDKVLCVTSTNLAPAFTIPDRRRHIVNIHNQIRELIEDCDWIFSIEDDGVLPGDALEKLIENTTKYESIGMITGVELGRHGSRYVGAWRVDDVFTPTKIESLQFGEGVNEIDGCGLYCALIRPDLYKSHEFYTKNGLGPDVNLGLYLKQQGYKNYIDWSIHVGHLANVDGEEVEIKADSESRVVKMFLLSGSTWGH